VELKGIHLLSILLRRAEVHSLYRLLLQLARRAFYSRTPQDGCAPRGSIQRSRQVYHLVLDAVGERAAVTPPPAVPKGLGERSRNSRKS